MGVGDFSVYDMIRRCAFAFGERPAIASQEGVLTHREFLERVDALATPNAT